MPEDWVSVEIHKCVDTLLTTNLNRVESKYVIAYWVGENTLRVDLKIQRPGIN